MTIANMTPRMRKALRNNKPLFYCGDLWKTVLNDKIDSQTDFESSVLSSNMDFTFDPGFARLEQDIAEYLLAQPNQNASIAAFDGVNLNAVVQGFYITPGRTLTEIIAYMANTAGVKRFATATIFNVDPHIGLYSYYRQLNIDVFGTQTYYTWPGLVLRKGIYVPAGSSGEVSFPVSPEIDLPEGNYWLVLAGASGVSFHYQNTDAYAGGYMTTFSKIYGTALLESWTKYATYDAYFKLELSGYKAAGSFTTRNLDLNKAPAQTGFFQIAVDEPSDTTLGITLYGSTTGAFAGEETTYTNIVDGWVAPAGIRYWRVKCDLTANADRSRSPLIDMLEFYYPDDRVRFRQKGVALFNVEGDIMRDFAPMLVPGSFSPSEIKPLERVSSLGSFPIELTDATPDRIQRIVSDAPLKNFRAALYLGADVPGFTESDLFRTCIGIVEAADVTPQYRGDSYRLSLTIKNPVTDLKRKAPLPEQTGLLDFETIAITEDKHALDAAVRVMRAYSRIPARYIDISSFTAGKLTAGSGNPAPEAHMIRRSNTATTYADGSAAPDTRIKSPTVIIEMLAPLMVIVDGYIAIDESSRIKYVHHDSTGSYEATWADESMRDEATGADAYIESVEKFLLGYGDFLYNGCYTGCEWNGSGDKWDAFGKVYGNIDADSADEFAPGPDVYVSIMEANMIAVSKWLGPESGYNGETLAQAIAARQVARFSYPPVRIQGATLPVSQYERGVGSIVRIWSKEFVKFKRRGIALSESMRFMITRQTYDQSKNRMKCDLLEMT